MKKETKEYIIGRMFIDTIYFKIIYIILSYLLGSVLFGYVVARILGKEGFGKVDRPGTAGAGRQYGLKAGIATFFFDFGKGLAVPLIGNAIGLDSLTILIATLAVLIGHNWSIFLKFKGGGGIAASMGFSAALVPIHFLVVLAISLTVGFTYKYTLHKKKHDVNPNVISSLLAVTIMPFFTYFLFTQPRFYLVDDRFLVTMMYIAVFIIVVAKGIILHFMYRRVPTAN